MPTAAKDQYSCTAAYLFSFSPKRGVWAQGVCSSGSSQNTCVYKKDLNNAAKAGGKRHSRSKRQNGNKRTKNRSKKSHRCVTQSLRILRDCLLRMLVHLTLAEVPHLASKSYSRRAKRPAIPCVSYLLSTARYCRHVSHACIAEGNQTPGCLLSLKSSAAAQEIKTRARNEVGMQTSNPEQKHFRQSRI